MAIGQGFGSGEWFWELVNRLRNERPSVLRNGWNIGQNVNST